MEYDMTSEEDIEFLKKQFAQIEEERAFWHKQAKFYEQQAESFRRFLVSSAEHSLNPVIQAVPLDSAEVNALRHKYVEMVHKCENADLRVLLSSVAAVVFAALYFAELLGWI